MLCLHKGIKEGLLLRCLINFCAHQHMNTPEALKKQAKILLHSIEHRIMDLLSMATYRKNAVYVF